MTGIIDHLWGLSHAADKVWADVVGVRPSRAGSRVIIVFQAYIDESVQKDGVYVLAGYVATIEKWANFSAEWEALLQGGFGTLKPNDTIKHFKYAEMKANPERAARIPVFKNTIKRHALFGISCKIDIRDHRRAMLRVHIPGVDIDFHHFRNPYIVSFRCLMDKFHNNRKNFSAIVPEGEPIDFIFDERTFEKRVIANFWDDYLAERPAAVRATYGSAPIFRNDNEYLPLQAADMLAGELRDAYINGEPIVLPFDSEPNLLPFLAIEFDEDALTEALCSIAGTNLPGRIVYDIKWREIDL